MYFSITNRKWQFKCELVVWTLSLLTLEHRVHVCSYMPYEEPPGNAEHTGRGVKTV